METGEVPIDTELYDRLTEQNSSLVTWTYQELNDYIRIFKEHGKNWKAISENLGTKDEKQCKHKGYYLLS